ncbi:MAG: transposase [Oscillospiraceae bacterium]|nr:transposase [Oscillospiraceae bacterium]
MKTIKIYISSSDVDMRKSIDGLAYMVEQKFKLPALFRICTFHRILCD